MPDAASFAPGATLPPEAPRVADAVLEDLWFGDDDPLRTHLEASRSMAASLGRATGLKPFPASAQRAIALLTNPDTPLRKIREAIEQDPAIATGLLRVANSVAYRARTTIASIEDAVQRLGSRHVLEIVTSVAAMGLFRDARGAGTKIRDHCSRVAAITRVLAAEWHQKTAENPFLCGLLHDLGKLLILQVDGLDYRGLDSRVLSTPDSAHVVERSLLGYDHAVLGGHVIEAWRLPEGVAEVVAWHHQPGRAYECGGEVALGVALVRIANRIDYQLVLSPQLNEAFLEELALDGAVSYTGYSRQVLAAMWPKFRESAQQVLTALK